MFLEKEPLIKVGLMSGAQAVRVTLSGNYLTDRGEHVGEGDYQASIDSGRVRLEGNNPVHSPSVTLAPASFEDCRFTLHDVTIGIDFHWQRKESQQFQGKLILLGRPKGLTLINEIPLESYLVSVISSEMSASCPSELLRAHAIVSRSWLLAQLTNASAERSTPSSSKATTNNTIEIIRWYDRECHSDYDVCADDHCQRYQGVSKAFSQAAFDAIRDTRGVVLTYEGEICDTRYSKSCGGMTEVYSAAWEEKDVPYLAAIYDGPGDGPVSSLPLDVEANAYDWITSSPEAYCNTDSPELLKRILPGFDQETRDFYRWEVDYSQEELGEILSTRITEDIGHIIALEPLVRGKSGRIIKLKIVGEKKTLIIGKELEIRRALSRSHLYSSAFVVRAEAGRRPYPARFQLIGAGWGHGVGLCQIGAAVMADRGSSHEEILKHYFRGARLGALY